MRLFDTSATRAALAFPALIDALRAMFAGGCEVPQRHVHPIGVPGEPATGTLLIMPAWRAGALLGVKTVGVFPGNAAQGLPAVHASYTLFDADTGVPLAAMDGSEITARRTAAASALAASLLARADAQHLLLVGAGRVAALIPEALRCVCPALRQVTVWNRSARAAGTLAAALRAQGFDAQAADGLDAAAAAAQIISCATMSTAPLVHGAALQPGTHLDLIGSFAPAMRETDGRCLERGRVFVDTPEALVKSGDLLQAAAEGCFDAARCQGTLEQLVRGERAGRLSDEEITIFKSVGTALEDLAAAELVWANR
jgi:ornithine cyclodeaminase